MRAAVIFVGVVLLVASAWRGEAAIKKPLFNGSIFGKRTTEYEATDPALSALCEIASETCQVWYQIFDKK